MAQRIQHSVDSVFFEQPIPFPKCLEQLCDLLKIKPQAPSNETIPAYLLRHLKVSDPNLKHLFLVHFSHIRLEVSDQTRQSIYQLVEGTLEILSLDWILAAEFPHNDQLILAMSRLDLVSRYQIIKISDISDEATTLLKILEASIEASDERKSLAFSQLGNLYKGTEQSPLAYGFYLAALQFSPVDQLQKLYQELLLLHKRLGGREVETAQKKLSFVPFFSRVSSVAPGVIKILNERATPYTTFEECYNLSVVLHCQTAFEYAQTMVMLCNTHSPGRTQSAHAFSIETACRFLEQRVYQFLRLSPHSLPRLPLEDFSAITDRAEVDSLMKLSLLYFTSLTKANTSMSTQMASYGLKKDEPLPTLVNITDRWNLCLLRCCPRLFISPPVCQKLFASPLPGCKHEDLIAFSSVLVLEGEMSDRPAYFAILSEFKDKCTGLQKGKVLSLIYTLTENKALVEKELQEAVSQEASVFLRLILNPRKKSPKKRASPLDQFKMWYVSTQKKLAPCPLQPVEAVFYQTLARISPEKFLDHLPKSKDCTCQEQVLSSLEDLLFMPSEEAGGMTPELRLSLVEKAIDFGGTGQRYILELHQLKNEDPDTCELLPHLSLACALSPDTPIKDLLTQAKAARELLAKRHAKKEEDLKQCIAENRASIAEIEETLETLTKSAVDREKELQAEITRLKGKNQPPKEDQKILQEMRDVQSKLSIAEEHLLSAQTTNHTLLEEKSRLEAANQELVTLNDQLESQLEEFRKDELALKEEVSQLQHQIEGLKLTLSLNPEKPSEADVHTAANIASDLDALLS